MWILLVWSILQCFKGFVTRHNMWNRSILCTKELLSLALNSKIFRMQIKAKCKVTSAQSISVSLVSQTKKKTCSHWTLIAITELMTKCSLHQPIVTRRISWFISGCQWGILLGTTSENFVYLYIQHWWVFWATEALFAKCSGLIGLKLENGTWFRKKVNSHCHCEWLHREYMSLKYFSWPVCKALNSATSYMLAKI